MIDNSSFLYKYDIHDNMTSCDIVEIFIDYFEEYFYYYGNFLLDDITYNYFKLYFINLLNEFNSNLDDNLFYNHDIFRKFDLCIISNNDYLDIYIDYGSYNNLLFKIQIELIIYDNDMLKIKIKFFDNNDSLLFTNITEITKELIPNQLKLEDIMNKMLII